MVKRGESLANYETVRLRKDGKRISVSVTDSPIRSEGVRVSGLSSIARDTASKGSAGGYTCCTAKDGCGRLARRRHRARLPGSTSSRPFSATANRRRGQIDERQWMYKHLTEIRKAADFAASLTHQLLAFSRRQPLFLRVFNLNDTVKSMGRNVAARDRRGHPDSHSSQGRDRSFESRPPASSSRSQLNLCVNARDAMLKGGSITIETADVTYFLDDFYSVNEMPCRGNMKVNRSMDNPARWDDARGEEAHFRAVLHDKGKGQGTGLGLANGYGIVAKQSSGYIRWTATWIRRTTFSIYLPQRVGTARSPAFVRAARRPVARRQRDGALCGGRDHRAQPHRPRAAPARLHRAGRAVAAQARDAIESHNGCEVHLLFLMWSAGWRKELAGLDSRDAERPKLLFTSAVDESISRGTAGTAPPSGRPFTPADLAKVRAVLDGADE